MVSFAIFPGQGSQEVGMAAELIENFASAKEVAEAADEALGFELSTLMREGSLDELSLTMNSQPALVTCSTIVTRVLEKEFDWKLADNVAFVAGHSLGEYSAHVAMGSIDFIDAVRLVRFRGEAMQRAVPEGQGAMVAVMGLEKNEIEEIIETVLADISGVCEIANDNAPGQLVISGSKEAVEKFTEIADTKGARKLVFLNVSAPFHSSLMVPAAKEMAEKLNETTISAPAKPILTNVSALPNSEPDKLRDDLINQVAGGVRWRETMLEAINLEGNNAMEIGSGKVLAGLLRRINRSIKVAGLSNLSDIHSFLAR